MTKEKEAIPIYAVVPHLEYSCAIRTNCNCAQKICGYKLKKIRIYGSERKEGLMSQERTIPVVRAQLFNLN